MTPDPRPGLFGSLLLAALIVIWATGTDADAGGYPPGWRGLVPLPLVRRRDGRAVYASDKLLHALASFALTLAGVLAFRLAPVASAWLVLGAGALLELAQAFPARWVLRRPGAVRGYADYRDWLADVAGVVLAAVVLDVVR